MSVAMTVRKTKPTLTGADLVGYVEAGGVVRYTDYPNYEPGKDLRTYDVSASRQEDGFVYTQSCGGSTVRQTPKRRFVERHFACSLARGDVRGESVKAVEQWIAGGRPDLNKK